VPMIISADKYRVLEPNTVQEGAEYQLLIDRKPTKRSKDQRTFKAGATGVAKWSGTFATVYANGYNRLDRSTLRVGLDMGDGEKLLFVSLKKLRLSEELMTDEQVMDRATRQAAQRCWAAPFVSLGLAYMA